jgi:nitrite reductase/ring-hydroxylating ferredoxin subunit
MSNSPTPEPPSDVTPGISRRIFQHCLLGLAPLTYAAAAVYAAGCYLLPFGKRRKPKLDVGATAEFAGDLVKEIEFNEDDVFVLKTDDGIQAFKRECPHLGCAISWVAGNNEFQCNCHGMAWQRNGKCIKGPVNKDISRQAFEIKAEHVILKDEEVSES